MSLFDERILHFHDVKAECSCDRLVKVPLDMLVPGKALFSRTGHVREVRLDSVVDERHTLCSRTAAACLYLETDVGLSIRPLEDERPADSQNQPASVTDLSTYVSLAATALSTLPEDAREEETKAKLVTPFVEALGWNKFDGREVRLEYTDSKTSHRPDYALFGPEANTPDVIVEAKQLGASLDQHEGQLNDYMRVFSADCGVLTNGQEFCVFNRIGDDALPEKTRRDED